MEPSPIGKNLTASYFWGKKLAIWLHKNKMSTYIFIMLDSRNTFCKSTYPFHKARVFFHNVLMKIVVSLSRETVECNLANS